MYDLVRFGSDDAVYKEARELLAQFRHANNPPTHARPGALPKDSYLTIRTNRDGTVDFNYASFGVRSMMLLETVYSEAVLNEATELYYIGRLTAKTAIACYRLQQEVARFIDGLRGEGPIDVDELMHFAIKSVHPYTPYKPYAPGKG